MISKSITNSLESSVCGFGRSGGNRLSSGAIFYAKQPGMVDIVGLSISDYLLVKTSLRPIFFDTEADPVERRPDNEIVPLAYASTELNDGGPMCGNEARDILLLFPDGTDEAILRKAYRYCGITYPSGDSLMFGMDNVLFGTEEVVF